MIAILPPHLRYWSSVLAEVGNTQCTIGIMVAYELQLLVYVFISFTQVKG